MYHGMMGNATVRGGEEGASSFIGVVLNFGTCNGYYTDAVRWWASISGNAGDDKSLAENVSMSELSPGATITMSVIADGDLGPAPYIVYAKNDGVITTYSAGFSVVASDYLKIGIAAPNQVDSGAGAILVFANGVEVAAIDYTYDPA